MNTTGTVARQLGATVDSSSGNRANGIVVAPTWLLAVMVSDAASVARLRGWASVSVERKAAGRMGMSAVVEA